MGEGHVIQQPPTASIKVSKICFEKRVNNTIKENWVYAWHWKHLFLRKYWIKSWSCKDKQTTKRNMQPYFWFISSDDRESDMRQVSITMSGIFKLPYVDRGTKYYLSPLSLNVSLFNAYMSVPEKHSSLQVGLDVAISMLTLRII